MNRLDYFGVWAQWFLDRSMVRYVVARQVGNFRPEILPPRVEWTLVGVSGVQSRVQWAETIPPP